MSLGWHSSTSHPRMRCRQRRQDPPCIPLMHRCLDRISGSGSPGRCSGSCRDTGEQSIPSRTATASVMRAETRIPSPTLGHASVRISSIQASRNARTLRATPSLRAACGTGQPGVRPPDQYRLLSHQHVPGCCCTATCATLRPAAGMPAAGAVPCQRAEPPRRTGSNEKQSLEEES